MTEREQHHHTPKPHSSSDGDEAADNSLAEARQKAGSIAAASAGIVAKAMSKDSATFLKSNRQTSGQ